MHSPFAGSIPFHWSGDFAQNFFLALRLCRLM
jgi:hypothetical protein